jgi:hypothetical protein
MKKHMFLAVIFVVSSVSSPVAFSASKKPPVYKPCASVYKNWQNRGKHWMAFAYSQKSAGGVACGWGEGYQTRSAAINRAMSECRLVQRYHPTWGKKNSCHIYKVK